MKLMMIKDGVKAMSVQAKGTASNVARPSQRKSWTLALAFSLTLSGLGLADTLANELVTVNGKGISAQDVNTAISNLPEAQRGLIKKDPQALRSVLQSMVNQELLVQEAEKVKLDQEPAYREAMAAFRKQYLAARLIEKNVGPKLSDKAAKSYYSNNKRLFSTDKVQVQHILLATEAEAREMLKKAKAAGADFQELAEKFSKDPSAKNNRGDIGVILRDSPFVKEFIDAAFESASGSIVGPVKTAYGFHVIKVVDRKLGRPLEYDEVELKVKGVLRDELVETFVASMRDKAKISFNETAVKAGL